MGLDVEAFAGYGFVVTREMKANALKDWGEVEEDGFDYPEYDWDDFVGKLSEKSGGDLLYRLHGYEEDCVALIYVSGYIVHTCVDDTIPTRITTDNQRDGEKDLKVLINAASICGAYMETEDTIAIDVGWYVGCSMF